MTLLSEAAADGIEPAVRGMLGDASDELVALASIAISLRRIADTTEGVVDHAHDAPAFRTRND